MKVLVISNNSFSKTQCNGKTLRSFFSKIGLDNIAQLYFGTNEVPDYETCNNYYRVTELQVLKSILNLSFTTANSHSSLMKTLSSGGNKDSKIFRLLKKYKGTLSVFREYLWSLNTWDSPTLKQWIESFHPDVIFTVLGDNIYVHKVAIKLSERYNIPLIAYFTDDYVINSTATNLFERIHLRRLRRQYEKTMNAVTKVYTIGEQMQKDYSMLYNKEFGILGNCIDFSTSEMNKPTKIDITKPIVISYIGGLHSNRWKSIAQLGEIIGDLERDSNYNIQIQVYTMDTLDPEINAAFQSANVKYCGSLNPEGVIEQMKQSHLLLHVESFDSRYRKYVKYSISTKISEYLQSMRMLIAFGPYEVASISVIRDNNLGCCLTDKDTPGEIKDKIRASIEQYNSYDFQKQYEYVRRNYDKERISQMLKNDLSDAIIAHKQCK